MTDRIPIECEARLIGLSKQRRKDGDWTEIRFHIHPNETPHALFILPLGTDCNLAISGMDEIDATAPAEATDADSPSEATQAPENPERPPGGPLARRAGILCEKREFTIWARRQAWVLWNEQIPAHPNNAADFLRRVCGVSSRAELDHDPEAAAIFDGVVDEFYRSQRGQSDDDMERMRR